MTEEALVSIRRINPPELGVPPGYSQVVEVRGGRIIFIAGQTALDRNGEVVGKANFAQQAAQVFQNLNIALQSVGISYILSLPLLRRGTSLVVVRPIGGVIAGKKVAANAAAIGGRGGGQIWRLGGHSFQ